MRLEGKIAIVTGAGRGLGKAISLRLAEEGCKAVIAEIDVELGEATAETIKASGSDCVAVHTDVANRQSIDHLVVAHNGAFQPDRYFDQQCCHCAHGFFSGSQPGDFGKGRPHQFAGGF